MKFNNDLSIIKILSDAAPEVNRSQELFSIIKGRFEKFMEFK